MKTVRRSLNNRLVVGLALLGLLGALVGVSLLASGRLLLDNARLEHRLEAYLAEGIQQATRQEQDIYRILAQQPKARFRALNQVGKLTFYITRNGQPWYWGDNSYVPDWQGLGGSWRYKTVLRGNFRYLLVHSGYSEPQDKASYQIYTLIPLFRRYQISNDLLKPFWPEKSLISLALSESPSTDPTENVKAPDGTFLFSFRRPMMLHLPGNQSLVLLLVGLATMSLTVLGYHVYRWSVHFLLRRGKTAEAFVVLLLSLSTVKAITWYFNLPAYFPTSPLLGPIRWTWAGWPRSAADLLIDLALVTLAVAFVFRYFFESKLYQRIERLAPVWHRLISLGAVGIWFVALAGFERGVYYLFVNPAWSPDVSLNWSPTLLRGVALLSFVLVSMSFFGLSHLLLRLHLRLCRKEGDSWLYGLPIAAGCVYVLGLGLGYGYWPLPCLFLAWVYMGLLTNLRLTQYISEPRYQTYLYLFCFCILAAGTTTYALYRHEQDDQQLSKTLFAQQVAQENDPLAELMLHEMAQEVAADPYIQHRLSNPMANPLPVLQKVRRQKLDKYLENYEVNLLLFGADGEAHPSTPSELDFYSLEAQARQPRKRTPYSEVWFESDLDKNLFRRYLTLVPIRQGELTLAYLVVELKQRKNQISNPFPELLVDKRLVPSYQSRSYSYAIFGRGSLVANYGSFNFGRDFDTTQLAEPVLYNSGLTLVGWHLLAVKTQANEVVVVASTPYPMRALLSNFSFLFLILVSLAGLAAGVNILRTSRRINLTLATKIQIYLNTAFMVPLTVVCVVALSVMSRNYQQDLNNSFIRRAEEAATHLAPTLNYYADRSLSLEELTRRTYDLARYTGADINLYASTGRILASNQPLIFERGLLSEWINPQAISEVIENRQKSVLLTEQVGQLGFKSVYVAIRSYETGKVLGVLSIPFFESNSELSHQVSDVVAIMLNIFTAVFIPFFWLSFYASQRLVVPLKLITNRLKRTSLAQNQPLEWRSKDEIGLLVDEYNRMLLKLESSREALATSEKESAWRQMAQQVAHEIKNPLTPMKLGLQHLQAALKGDHPRLRELTERTTESLLNQVETLSDIATSFATFAKMPTPASEPVDLDQVLRQTANLFRDTQEVRLQLFLPGEPCQVMGDERLLSRILTNLILNAIQAVPEGRTPEIELSLDDSHPGFYRLEVADNGAGIPASIRPLIFSPRFTTKTSGSGIGLAVAKRGIEQMGGRIYFETREQEGTRFFIELPRGEG